MSKHRATVDARRGLVSVIIPTYNRPELLLNRSIPSVLAQTHGNLELLVIGDGATDEVCAAMATVTDPRVRFIQRPRPEYPPGELDAWHVSGSYAFNYGLDSARGGYVCGLGDDDALDPRYIEELLEATVAQGTGGAYCASMVHKPDGGIGYLGLWNPPRFACQCGGEFLYRRNSVRLDPECWMRGLPNDWDFVARMMSSGITFAHVRKPLYHYFPLRHIPPGAPTM